MAFSGPQSDQLAIRQLLNAYDDAVAMRDVEAWASAWTPDAQWNIAGKSASGVEALKTLWLSIMAQTQFVALSSTPGLIEVVGDEARGRVHTAETIFFGDGSEKRFWGRYEDTLRRTNGEWRFSIRTYQMLRQA
ncbi:MAG: nuclear transport factor 2 family protein [Rhodospirillales bacterium]|nr:nuclear transport factor 2 family protein [Rhodospirillales bacterium]